MLFNSWIFLLAFLPLALAGFYGLSRVPRAAFSWLALASLVFYGWWNPRYLVLLVGSIAFNLWAGRRIGAARDGGRERSSRRALWFAVGVNLLVLGVFKYAGFFTENLARLTELPIAVPHIVLPLGISFFTFTQIAFLVDASRGNVPHYRAGDYLLFVSWFPHLIAGPLLHHRDMVPQFRRTGATTADSERFAVGLTIFAIGLFKKTVLADPLSGMVGQLFVPGIMPTGFDAWGAALAYTLQLYFDFSGYSDMAVGLSRLFGITLPVNFASPYKATNLIDFWKRWHMTLSGFLREYLYIPLGGNRHGTVRRYVNITITMVLGGLWHGAGWTFVAWGAWHAACLSLNHVWRALRGPRTFTVLRPIGRFVSGALTFGVVVVGWVFFRSGSLDVAGDVLAAMMGQNGWALPAQWITEGAPLAWAAKIGVRASAELALNGPYVLSIAAGLAVVWCLPNTQQLVGAVTAGRVSAPANASMSDSAAAAVPASMLRWTPSVGWQFAVALLLGVALAMMDRHAEFLYFQF